MKPRKPLERRTPLRAKTSLPRTGGLKRGPVKPRRYVVSPEERDARLVVQARSRLVCEVCGVAPMQEYQHRKAKAHCAKAELWDPANGLAVCGHGNLDGCHGRIHCGPTEAYANGWSVLSGQDPAAIPVLRRGSLVWLRSDGTYTSALGETA